VDVHLVLFDSFSQVKRHVLIVLSCVWVITRVHFQSLGQSFFLNSLSESVIFGPGGLSRATHDEILVVVGVGAAVAPLYLEEWN
jgi:hypothetical protein